MIPSKSFDILACHVWEWPSDFTWLHYTSTHTLNIVFAIQGRIISIVGGGWGGMVDSSISISQHLRVIIEVAISSGEIHDCVLSSHFATAEVFTFLFIFSVAHTQTHIITHMSQPSTFFCDDALNGVKVHLALCAHVCMCVCVCEKQGPSTCAGWKLIRLGPSFVSVAERCG